MYSQFNISEITFESKIFLEVRFKLLVKISESSHAAISSKDKVSRVSLNLSNESWLEWLKTSLKDLVSIWSSFNSGNKKNSSSVLLSILEKLLTNLGINLSTELRVLPETKLHFKEVWLVENSGLMKFSRSKLEFWGSPPHPETTMKKIIKR